MRSGIVALGVLFLFFSTLSYAQQELIGTYEGRWMAGGSGDAGAATLFPNYGTLKIVSAENGKLSGTFTVGKYYCSGEYLIEGSYHDNKLEMRTGQGAKRDCGKEPLVVVVEGNKLVGKYSTYDIELSKK